MKKILLLLAVLAVAVGALVALRAGAAPAVTIDPAAPGFGKRTPVKVTVAEPRRGLSGVRVELVQGGRAHPLVERRFTPLPPWKPWGERTPTVELDLEVGSETVPGLETGEATLRVVAERAPAALRAPEPTVAEVTLPVRLTPPSVQVLSTQTYVNQGGCEVVVYRLGDGAVRDGVSAGSWFFPGYPLPGGGKHDRFALFAVPYDLGEASAVRLLAADALGNEARVGFVDQFRAKPFATDEIALDDRFLGKVVPEIIGQTSGLADRGKLIDNYLQINRDLRRKNAATLVELGRKSRPEFLWSEVFLPLPNAAVMSAFADRRTYVYGGQEVDQQFHLGFDLAALAQTPIPAANRGVVVLARYFGIYGNAVVLDHGYGLQSLYGHLSSLDVQEGQTVERGAILGRSGQTGLAGGDHLHFTMLLHGLAVNPVEWWDAHWIQDRLDRKLGAALPFGNS
jgi:murein DD-endopeptidase MepM/ murein hydrolase activator NlpD